MAIPTCLLSLLCGWWLGAARTRGLSVVGGLLSVIFSPGSTIVRLGAWGGSRSTTSGHLSLFLIVLLPGFCVILLGGSTRLLRLLAYFFVIFFPGFSVV